MFLQTGETQKNASIVSVRSDRRGEFVNAKFEEFCSTHGYIRNFSSPRTPQQNGIVQRKNRTLQQMARIMIQDYGLHLYFMGEATQTAWYLINRVSIDPSLRKRLFELF